MPWSGYPETEVTQLEFSEWIFSLKPKREVLIGYSVRVAGGWELFGNGHWVWFTGAVRSYRGAVQIVSQWAEAETLGARNRIWQWVHWRNPLDVDVVAQPYFVLVPPLASDYLPQMEPLTAKKSLWTVADITSNAITAIGTEWGAGSPGDDGGGDDGNGDDGGGGDHEGGEDGGGEGGRNGLKTLVALRPLKGQRVLKVELKGDLRYLPVQALWRHADRLVARSSRAEKTRRRAEPPRGRRGRPRK